MRTTPSWPVALYMRALAWLAPRRMLVWRVIRRVVIEGRGIITSVADRPWVFTLYGQELLVPMSHDLPLIMAVNPHYGSNLVRLAGVLSSSFPERSVIDVGANVGDSAVLVRSVCDLPVVCIEGDPVFSLYLSSNTQRISDVYVHTCFVEWDSPEHRVPLRSRGTATLTPSPEGFQGVSLASIVDSTPGLPLPILVKVDTDGGDGAVLRAAANFLIRARPVLFFEYDPRRMRTWGELEPAAVFDLLDGCGYDVAIVYDNNGRYLANLQCRDAEGWRDLTRYLDASSAPEYLDVACFPRDFPVQVVGDVLAAEREFMASLERGIGGDAVPNSSIEAA